MAQSYQQFHVPTGMLLAFADPYSMAAGAATAMAFFREIKPQSDSDAISLEVDIEHQKKIDEAWNTGTELPPVEDGEKLFVKHDGEVYLNRRSDFGHLIIVINYAVKRHIPVLASADFSLSPSDCAHFTVSKLYELHAKHAQVVHICSVAQAELMKAYF